MTERRKIGEKERELLPLIVEYVKEHHLDKEDGLAIALLCNTDEKSIAMINFLKNNPDADFDTVFEKAVELNGF